MALPDAKGWSKNLTGKTFQKHLYDTLKYPIFSSDKELKKGNRPDSEDALKFIDTDFTKKIILIRKQTHIKKVIDGYFKESVDGIIRPSYGLGNVDTMRTSANSPNIQNPFKRNKFAKKMLREMIVPSPGRQIVGKDYKAIEVSIAGCIFPDDAWLNYCINWKTSDMHRDCSAEILKVSIDNFKQFEMLKAIRQEIKGNWVFPNIYGSGAAKMSRNLWEALQQFPEAMAALAKWGYTSENTFKMWIKEYYDYYWNEKYPDYKDQRDKAYARYEKYGYIDSPVGYRYYGPMSYNDFCNYPVQGSAAAIKIWAIKEGNKALVANKMDSRIIYEIHDELGGDVVPDERKEYDRIIEDIATVKVREYWSWIITPLILETEESSVDGDWSEMEEIE
jgi:DNA polymerase I-like protein with 3'-5' exonuclease and polymerase domains